MNLGCILEGRGRDVGHFTLLFVVVSNDTGRVLSHLLPQEVQVCSRMQHGQLLIGCWPGGVQLHHL